MFVSLIESNENKVVHLSEKNNSKRHENRKIESKDITFPELKVFNPYSIIEDIDEYVSAFDECLRIVEDIIDTDIWPRFIKSSSYADAVKSYNALSSTVSV